jgi:hypothetical protein
MLEKIQQEAFSSESAFSLLTSPPILSNFEPQAAGFWLESILRAGP